MTSPAGRPVPSIPAVFALRGKFVCWVGCEKLSSSTVSCWHCQRASEQTVHVLPHFDQSLLLNTVHAMWLHMTISMTRQLTTSAATTSDDIGLLWLGAFDGTADLGKEKDGRPSRAGLMEIVIRSFFSPIQQVEARAALLMTVKIKIFCLDLVVAQPGSRFSTSTAAFQPPNPVSPQCCLVARYASSYSPETARFGRQVLPG